MSSNYTAGSGAVFTPTITTLANGETVAAADLYDAGIKLNAAGTRYAADRLRRAFPESVAFTATNATDTFTSTSHLLINNGIVTVSSTATLPAGLTEETHYYVINRTEDTFQLSLSAGGAAVSISDDGTGTHAFYPVVAHYGHVLITGNSAAILTPGVLSGAGASATFTVPFYYREYIITEQSVDNVTTMQSTSPIPPTGAEVSLRFVNVAGTKKVDVKNEAASTLCTFPAGSHSWARLKFINSAWAVIEWGGGTTAVV